MQRNTKAGLIISTGNPETFYIGISNYLSLFEALWSELFRWTITPTYKVHGVHCVIVRQRFSLRENIPRRTGERISSPPFIDFLLSTDCVYNEGCICDSPNLTIKFCCLFTISFFRKPTQKKTTSFIKLENKQFTIASIRITMWDHRIE